MNPSSKNVLEVIEKSQTELKDLLIKFNLEKDITPDNYVKYLSIQYHLTKNVFNTFITISEHTELARFPSLQRFLVNFAKEEEFHYQVAENDIRATGKTLLEAPEEAELWVNYLKQTIQQRPFVRLGVTCVLENISGKSRELLNELVKKSSFLNPKNTIFLAIHQHDDSIPHGDQILDALFSVDLSNSQISDLTEGAQTAATVFLRLIHWSLYS